ncbi:4-hydroxy-tetrahydrodipicolinate reductase [Ehrlichia ruminantium]|uniref:4-hydroxy-tetrahydrodipicolinate reductase n=1 Tax=Ehrlichia ruminantium TaxID=779 RepID=A0AAE6QAZ4_EHRRU|nr:4-hydroxy-tetrahydrodipicolinate reductase [Ehrlichia ruminantium]QGR02638.1 4-hydroxy-tetrahydrodipicolinate reductase [Ehrlichia ruminantium]QGR03558.1 4-hydroxy-tetrahydrodipicolinate reductase [Ehrlichia ruminantium]QGR04485.1 4-hydroxy-tetrahydrodipicolinate reductase [Ehrlichia ruminantium]
MNKVKVGIVGCLGRQGRHLVNEISASDLAQVSAGLVRTGNEYVGRVLGSIVGCNCDAKITDSLEYLFDVSDVVIEFTNPNTMIECMKMAELKKKPMVSGTTGMSENMVFQNYIKSVPLLWSANLSFSMNIMLKLVENAAKMLSGYDIEIWEIHHRYKKDAPSGTSLMLGKAAAKGMGAQFKMNQYIKGGQESRQDSTSIGYAVSRGGLGLSDHKIIFAGDEDVLEFSHRTTNKNVYAKGALKAALWLIKQPAGIYTVSDIMMTQ